MARGLHGYQLSTNIQLHTRGWPAGVEAELLGHESEVPGFRRGLPANSEAQARTPLLTLSGPKREKPLHSLVAGTTAGGLGA